jgi:hypothetical protein
MEFTELLAEWLDLRDDEKEGTKIALGQAPQSNWPRSMHRLQVDRLRMAELADEMNKRMRGEL